MQALTRREPALPRVPLIAGPHAIGSIARPLLAELLAAPLPLAEHGGAAHLQAPWDEALDTLADWLRANGHAGRWRDERIAVPDNRTGQRVSRVERGVSRNLGITTCAVQVHAAVQGQPLWWLQQRALDKATDPGRWDSLAGGLVADGEHPAQAAVREAWEEAGVRVEQALDVRACGRYTVRRPVDDSGSHGYMVEVVHTYAWLLPPGLQPDNRDGEVMAFAAHDTQAIDERVAHGELTLEAAVAIALSAGVAQADTA